MEFVVSLKTSPVWCFIHSLHTRFLTSRSFKGAFWSRRGLLKHMFLILDVFAFPFSINCAILLKYCRWTAEQSTFFTHKHTHTHTHTHTHSYNLPSVSHNTLLISCLTFQHWWDGEYVLNFTFTSGDCFFVCWGTGLNGFSVECYWMQRKAWFKSSVLNSTVLYEVWSGNF